MAEGPAIEPALHDNEAGGGLWAALGRRLERRRIELRYSAERVAQRVGIPVEAYRGYENGAPIPASVLAEIAEALDRPAAWFFDGLARQEPVWTEAAANAPPAVGYRVATVEHRLQVLADSFRKLDLEGQQHLLAISRALLRSGACVPRD